MIGVNAQCGMTTSVFEESGKDGSLYDFRSSFLRPIRLHTHFGIH